LTDDTKRILEFAVLTARQMLQSDIGTEHLLMGLMRQHKPGVVDMLAHCGTTPEIVMESVKVFLSRPKE
jgi:ATP-dependent Clp protease ATP-binding subunit ClpA